MQGGSTSSVEQRFNLRSQTAAKLTIQTWSIRGAEYLNSGVKLKLRVVRHDKELELPKSCVAVVQIKQGNGKKDSNIRTDVILAPPDWTTRHEVEVEDDKREIERLNVSPSTDSFVEGLITIDPRLPEGHFEVTVTIELDNGLRVTMAPFTLWVDTPYRTK
jgi:hypothetical protein